MDTFFRLHPVMVSAVLLALFAVLALTSCATIGRSAPPFPPALQDLADGMTPEDWLAAHPDIASPIVEGNRVTFFCTVTGMETRADSIWVEGDFNGWSKAHALRRYRSSPLFWRTVTIANPDGQRYGFRFSVHGGGAEPGPGSGPGSGTAVGEWTGTDPLNRIISYATPVRSMIRTQDSPVGRIEFYPMMATPSGIPARDVWVYLPPGYSRNPDRRYPVLYLHDGQQVWDSFAAAYGGWKVDRAEEALLAAGKVEPFIIVGIKNSMFRPQEFIGYSAYYGPAAHLYDAGIAASALSMAEAYREFVCDRVKPFIDRTYRTLPDRENTAIGGSSFGASASLYIACTRPELFGKVAALSGGNYLPEDTSREQKNIYQPYPWLIANAIGREPHLKIYLDCGGLDVDAIFLPRTQEMISALHAKGYRDGVDMLSAIDPRAGHNEREWAKRMPTCLEFLFPAR